MTFLECINRIFRLNAIIRGDTDPIATFSDISHNASMTLAIICVQDELTSLIAEKLIPKERNTSQNVTFATGTRVYNLPSNFIRFYGEPCFYRAAENRKIYEYRGGLVQLQNDIWDYATQEGDPNWWYFEPTSQATKQVGFFQVPTSSENGEVWTFEYEASVMISLSTDDLPFHNDEENFTFTQMASRRFKFSFEDVEGKADIQGILDQDRSYITARATLYKLLRGQNPQRYYGASYA